MEVVQELLDPPKLKNQKNKNKATGSAKIIVDRVTRDQVRPGTSQQHGPKAFVWIQCPVSQPLYFS